MGGFGLSRGTRVTIRDVALASDVSVGTASRAINNHPSVFPATRERVVAAAARLGYVPDRAARSLRTGRTGAVGCVLSFGQHPIASALISGIEPVLRDAGFAVVYGNSVDRPENEANLLSFFGSNRVDGLITNLARDEDADIVPQLQSLGVPVVLFERNPQDAFDTVLSDQGGGSYMATSYLLSLGHRRIAFAVGALGTLPGRARLSQFLRAHVDHGCEADRSLFADMVSPADFGFAESLELLSRPDPPSAVIVGAYEVIGLLRAVRHLGLSVPEDMSIICFGETPLADLFDPPLTLVRWDGVEHGRVAAELLLRRIEGDTRPPERISIDTSLIHRASCRPFVAENRR